MQCIIYLFLFSTLLQNIAFDEIAPRSTEAFRCLVVAIKNETIEAVGFYYATFNRFLQEERAKSSDVNF